MARTRFVVSVPLIPWLIGRGLRGLLALALVACVLVLAFAWPLVVWHTTETIPRHCVMAGFGIPDCTPAHQADGPPTGFGWFMELVWLTVLAWTFRSWKRASRVIAQTQAEGRQPKAGPGPRDYHLAPPVKP